MSDTVLIALITASSGFVGAFLGYLTARMSAKEQRKREAEAALFQTRLRAYTDFLEALEQWALAPCDLELKARLFRKAAEARLTASEECEHHLNSIQLYVLKRGAKVSQNDHEAFLQDKALMMAAMREDLSLVKGTKKPYTRPT